MSDQFLGEIRIVPFTFAPLNWALCNGQILSISQSTALFSLLGTQYGGDGESTFALPNLQGCAPMNQGNGEGLSPRIIGEIGGETAVTLLTTQMPSHTHPPESGASSNAASPGTGMIFGGGGRGKQPAYAPPPASVPMSALAVGTVGGSGPHNNLPPYLTLNFAIALTGIFPPRS
jgi:microcystin-dependent protein